MQSTSATPDLSKLDESQKRWEVLLDRVFKFNEDLLIDAEKHKAQIAKLKAENSKLKAQNAKWKRFSRASANWLRDEVPDEYLRWLYDKEMGKKGRIEVEMKRRRLQKAAEALPTEMTEEYLCPITKAPMLDPVTLSDGTTYERHAIERWLRKKKRSPATNLKVNGKMKPNIKARKAVVQAAEAQLEEWGRHVVPYDPILPNDRFVMLRRICSNSKECPTPIQPLTTCAAGIITAILIHRKETAGRKYRKAN